MPSPDGNSFVRQAERLLQLKDTSVNLIERYLTELADIRATRAHVPETSFYPALEGLLNEVGKALSPKVRCVMGLQNRGAGLPDGGLFTADQFRRRTPARESDGNLFLRELPARGVIEAKPPAEDVRSVAETEQVGRYWKRYGTVLVTNFRAFALVAKDVSGRPVILESFSLAESESEFWRLTAHPRKTGGEQGARMVEYLRRVLLHNAPLAAPQDVAALLASAALGRQVAALLDTEAPVTGVTVGQGNPREDLKDLAVFVRVDGKPAKPEVGDLDLTVGWGHTGKGGVTMPGKGKILDRGDGAYDIYLNDIACWRSVPEEVWEYTIGGYQVIKKWLSYREKDLLGRGLTPEEVRYVTEMARRLAALVSLRPDLDANYRAVMERTFDWMSP